MPPTGTPPLPARGLDAAEVNANNSVSKPTSDTLSFFPERASFNVHTAYAGNLPTINTFMRVIRTGKSLRQAFRQNDSPSDVQVDARD